MTDILWITANLKSNSPESNLAESITRTASRQTYYTIRWLADRGRAANAYRAYAYFRWVDDQLDQERMNKLERLNFVGRQQGLIERCYRGECPRELREEEVMLADLVRSDREGNSGLQSYIRNMMAVMAFDAERRGRLISARELKEYTRHLAVAVTEAMHYFIGHCCKSPQDRTRYVAVRAAHITHMLRDTLEDIEAGYFNIPREYVEAHRMDPGDIQSEAYREWIGQRVRLARACFQTGRRYLARVENLRCRLAGFAYAARFESLLSVMEGDGYHLRKAYPDGGTLAAGIQWIGPAFWTAFGRRSLESVAS